ncbi:MAG: PEP-CTERM sorting domain-containing protein [Pseudomonadales bacterium]|nr:PEP-CTERM sorting domain-containing protein [Pseudomonadales bacterium]
MTIKNQWTRGCFAAALIGTAGSAYAVPFTLDFEGVGDQAQIQDFYNGGTDSDGNSGTNYGVGFGDNALGVVDGDAGGNGNFANEPSPDTIMFFLSGSSILNYSPGFDTGFSFYYTTSQAASVTVWDQENAGGSLLGQIDLVANSTANNCAGDPSGQFCNFDVGNVTFSGTAKSIDFSGTANQVGFDNITFGSDDPNVPGDDTPTTVVPEPSTLVLLGLGLIGVSVTRRRLRMTPAAA